MFSCKILRSSSHTLGIDVLRTCKGVLNSLDCTYLAGRERIFYFLSDKGATTEMFRSFTLGDVGEKSRSLLDLSGDRIVGELLFLSSSFRSTDCSALLSKQYLQGPPIHLLHVEFTYYRHNFVLLALCVTVALRNGDRCPCRENKDAVLRPEDCRTGLICG